VDAAYLLRTSRSASMVQASGGEEIKSRRSKRGRGSSVASSEGSQRSGSIVSKNGSGKPKIEARHIVIQRKKASGKSAKVEEPKVKLQYAINREEEEELNKSDHESSEEEQEEEIKSSSSSDGEKSYVIPEDDDLSTVGIMEEIQPQKDSMKNLSIDQIRGATSPTKQQ
jgi:1-aminocyclopropane-1-carboxylate deaminase/D-cysteine desulfhydrase-like pyridoxal-dependent ACC family enzyme